MLYKKEAGHEHQEAHVSRKFGGGLYAKHEQKSSRDRSVQCGWGYASKSSSGAVAPCFATWCFMPARFVPRRTATGANMGDAGSEHNPLTDSRRELYR